MGIEATSRAWEARILPMNYAREQCYDSRFGGVCQTMCTAMLRNVRTPRKRLVTQVVMRLSA